MKVMYYHGLVNAGQVVGPGSGKLGVSNRICQNQLHKMIGLMILSIILSDPLPTQGWMVSSENALVAALLEPSSMLPLVATVSACLHPGVELNPRSAAVPHGASSSSSAVSW